jgi:CHASE2 domain-containing sensor protein
VSLAIGGLIVGALDGRGLLNKIPTIGGSRAMTLGIAGYLVTRFVKHPMARNAGLAALAAAAYDYGKVHLGSGGGSSSAAVAPVPPPAGKGTVGGHDDPSGSRGDGGPY